VRLRVSQGGVWAEKQKSPGQIVGNDDVVFTDFARVAIELQRDVVSQDLQDSFEDLVLLLRLEETQKTSPAAEIALVVRFLGPGQKPKIQRIPSVVLERNVTDVRYLDVRINHPLVGERFMSEDHVVVPHCEGFAFDLKMCWTETRSNWSKSYEIFTFKESVPDQYHICDQFYTSLDQTLSVQHSFVQSHGLLLDKMSASQQDMVFKSNELTLKSKIENEDSLRAVQLLENMEPRLMKPFGELLLTRLEQVCVARGEALHSLMQDRPDILVLAILVLEKLCDDYWAHDLPGMSNIFSSLGSSCSEMLLLDLLTLASSFMDRSFSRGDSESERQAVTFACCTVALANLRKLTTAQNSPHLGELLNSLFRSLCKRPSLILSWSSVTRLFPAILASAEPGIIARDLQFLLQRSFSDIWRRKVKSVTFILEGIAHLLENFDEDEHFEWTNLFLPSTEAWVQLHLIKPASTILVRVLENLDLHQHDADGFDSAVEALSKRLQMLVSSSELPRKLDAGLMSPGWALEQCWPLTIKLVESTAALGENISKETLQFLVMFADADSREEQGQQSLLCEYLQNPSLDPERVEKCVRTLQYFVSDLRNSERVTMVAEQLVDLLLSVYDLNCSKSAEKVWKSTLDLLLAAARIWKTGSEATAMLKALQKAVIQVNWKDEPGIPWFCSKLVRGLCGIATFRDVSHDLLDRASALLNYLAIETNPAVRNCVHDCCKLVLVEIGGLPHKEVDRWILSMEDICTDKDLNDHLFAIRALLRALLRDPGSGLLHLDLAEKLFWKDLTVRSPWFHPHVDLLRKVEDRSSPEAVELLEFSIEHLRIAAESLEANSDLVLVRALVLQMEIRLQLQKAGDDLAKDKLVEHVLSIVEENKSGKRLDYETRQVILNAALVEDALEEEIPLLWDEICTPNINLVQALELNRAGRKSAFRLAQSSLIVFADEKWQILGVDIQEPVQEFCQRVQASAELDSRSPKARLQTSELRLPKDEFLGCGNHLFLGYSLTEKESEKIVVFALKNNDNVQRIELGYDVELAGQRQGRGKNDLGKFFLARPLHLLRTVSMEMQEAVEMEIVLAIRHLKSYLEHEVWLPHIHHGPHAGIQRVAYYHIMLNSAIAILQFGFGFSQVESLGTFKSDSAVSRLAKGFLDLCKTVLRSIENSTLNLEIHPDIDFKVTQLQQESFRIDKIFQKWNQLHKETGHCGT